MFDNPKRAVLSAYTEVGEHVGEGEIILDGKEGAELSVLIGRKDLWRHGYGTAVVQSLIAKAFDDMSLQKVWAMVPDENAAARGLFRKLGSWSRVRASTADMTRGPTGRLQSCR